MPLPLSRSSSIHPEVDVLSDCKIVLRKLDNMKNVVARSNFFMDSKLMMLKLRRARLGAQLAYSRHQSLLDEFELRLAEADLKNELTRRRQHNRSHARPRHTMKSLSNVASKKNKATEVDKDAFEKSTVDKSTQVDEVADQTAQSVEKTDKAERRKDSVSKKRRRTDKDAPSKEKAKTSSGGTDVSHSIDKATTSSKEIIAQPNKKQKTDVESHCSADKGEKINRHNKDHRDSREKRKERRDSKRSSKDKSSKTDNHEKSATPNNKKELHNDKHKGKDSETNGKPAKNRHEGQVKKPAKSVSTNPIIKDICKGVKTVNNDVVSNGNKSEEYSEPNLSRNVEKTLLTVEDINYVCEASEGNSDKHIESTATDEVVQPSVDNKCYIFSNSCNLDENDAASRPDFSVLCNIIQEMCEASEREVIDNDFEELGAVKRERSHSISSVETLKL